MKTVAFVPIKMNSERLPGKNVRPFTNGRPLLTYILDTLTQVAGLDEIYVYCSDESVSKYCPPGVRFLKRDPYYDLSSTPFNEVLASFARLVEADIYVLTHATAPFMSAESISAGVGAVKGGGYDSALAAVKLQEFLWKDGRPFNYRVDDIPRTQDLEPMYAETCGLYIFTRELILGKNRRIGERPYLLEVSKIEAQDINDELDFQIADAVFGMMNSAKKPTGGGYSKLITFSVRSFDERGRAA